jgi:acetyl esterase/lipase
MNVGLVMSVAVLAGSCCVCLAAEPEVVLLWPGGAPGAKGDADGDKPNLIVYLPSKQTATGCGIVICPGGGYGNLAMDHEGHQVATWLNSIGVAGFILKYRHHGTGYGHPAPLQDAQRALRIVRSRAKELGVDPKRIGIMGFSAGGHLASTVGTHFKDAAKPKGDAIDEASCRPDFMILGYPVITFTKPYTHRGSLRNLLGPQPDKALVESLSNETQVTADTPPTFLVHADDDKGVPPENSICFYQALRRAKVPAEMHIYLKGRHGFGMRVKNAPVASWTTRCADWLGVQGLLRKQ